MRSNTSMSQLYSQLSRICAILLFVFLIFALVSMLLPAPPIQAAGNTYYVSKSGNDNSSGTQSQPWRTLEKAVRTATAGDTVYVRGGTYNEWFLIDNHSGTAANPIRFLNYPGENPIIDGAGLSDPGEQRGVITIGRSYIHVEGFEVKNGIYQGIFCWGGSPWTGITVKDCVVHDCGYSGVNFSAWGKWDAPLSNITIDGVEIYRCNGNTRVFTDENLTIMNVNGFEVKNCHLHDNIDKEGIDAKCGSKNGSIHHNEVEDSDAVGIYIDGFNRSQSNIDVYSNKVHNCRTGMGLAAELGNYSMMNINFYNNIVYQNNSGFSIWPSYEFNKTFTMINNTFYNNTNYAISVSNPARYNVNCVIRNNILVGQNSSVKLLNYPDYANGGITIDHNLFYSPGGYSSSNRYGTNYIRENPLLVNPPYDFRISDLSPAKNEGSASLAPSTDYTGASRPQGGAYDIGAYEYVDTESTQIVEPEKPASTSSNWWIIGLALLACILIIGGYMYLIKRKRARE